MRIQVVAGALLVTASPLVAQRVTIGAQLALAEYREQAAPLRFRGSGASASLDFAMGRFGLRATTTHLRFQSAGADSAGSDPFDLAQSDVAFRVHVARGVSFETGIMSRVIEPARGAQSVSAVRVGAAGIYPLAPGAGLTMRVGWLGATRFSGGGSAPFGIELSLGASYGPGSGRVRATGEFDFQRIDRRTTIDGVRQSVPLQSSIARVGVAVAIGK